MDRLEREYALIYRDIRQSTESDISKSFETEISNFASALLDKITAKRDEMLALCQTRRQELENLAQELDMVLEEIPEILPPYEPLFQMLDQRAEEGRKIAAARKAKVQSYFEEAAEIAHAIDLSSPLMPENLHIAGIEELKRNLMDLRAERARRFEKLEKLLDQVSPLYQELEYEGVAVNLNQDPFMNLKDAQLQMLETEIRELQVLKQQRREQSQTLQNEISYLANHLGTSVAFTAELSEFYIQKLERTRNEMSRELEKKIAERIQQATEIYLENCRNLFIEPVEFSGEHTIETYESILSENRKLDELIVKRERIDKAYQEYKSLLDDEKQLQEAAKNPQRFKERGSVLLEENKRRNRVTTRKPMVMKRIAKLLGEWEEKQATPFLVDDGQELKAIIKTDMAKDNRKPSVRAARSAMDAINSKATKPVKPQGPTSINSRAIPPAKRPVRPPPRAAANTGSSAPIARARPATTNSVKIQQPRVCTTTRGSAPRDAPGTLRSGPSARPVLSLLDENRVAETPAKRPKLVTSSLRTPTFNIENLSSIESPAITPASPSIKSRRESRACDGLSYEPKRSVTIPHFDPDFSIMDPDQSSVSLRAGSQDVAYRELRRESLGRFSAKK